MESLYCCNFVIGAEEKEKSGVTKIGPWTQHFEQKPTAALDRLLASELNVIRRQQSQVKNRRQKEFLSPYRRNPA
jgi:hypothetical protein